MRMAKSHGAGVVDPEAGAALDLDVAQLVAVLAGSDLSDLVAARFEDATEAPRMAMRRMVMGRITPACRWGL
jgi:hypothetical protein